MVMKKNIDAMNHPTKVKESIGERIYTIVVYLLLILISATIILPLLHIISGSFSDPMQLLTGNVSFWPKGFTTSMYEKVLKDASIWKGYLNTILYTVLGTLISVTLTACAAIPNDLIEAAALDGCNDITTFFRIVLPLSGAVFAVMALFYGVAQWNSWFPALLYIRDRSLYPLQMILREVLIQSDIGNMAGSTGDVEVIGDGLKYATMVVSTLPIMCLYPFLQKYFVAGVTIGAVKG